MKRYSAACQMGSGRDGIVFVLGETEARDRLLGEYDPLEPGKHFRFSFPFAVI